MLKVSVTGSLVSSLTEVTDTVSFVDYSNITIQ